MFKGILIHLTTHSILMWVAMLLGNNSINRTSVFLNPFAGADILHKAVSHLRPCVTVILPPLHITAYPQWNHCNTWPLMAFCFIFSGVCEIRHYGHTHVYILMFHTRTQFIAIILIHLDAPVIIRLEAVKLGEMECKWG